MFLRGLLLLLCTVSNSGVNAAAVSSKKISSGSYNYVFIDGVITQADVHKVKNVLSTKTGTIYLNSPGGDLDAALKIGDLIYKTSYKKEAYKKGGGVFYYDFSPSVAVGMEGGGNSVCASACVAIFASAKSRFILCSILHCDPLVVHNPYAVDTSLDYDQIKAQLGIYKKRAVNQFNRVGVSGELWSLMINTRSESPRKLSVEEVERLGLKGDDPVYSDYRNGVEARRFGYTKSEYLERKRRADVCGLEVPSFKGNSWTIYDQADLVLACEKKFGVL
jgi:hypothetical protein